MARTGTAHKVISVLLRLTELACGMIVLAILARFTYLFNSDDRHPGLDGRITYAMVVACMTIVYAAIVCAPLKTLFLGFPVDFVLFIMWLVAYALLQDRTSGGTCSSTWYRNYWGYYWGRFWRVGTPVQRIRIDGAGCTEWRTVLAFSFIAWLFHLASGILGIYVFRTYIRKDATHDAEKSDRRCLQKDSHEHQTNDGQSEATMTPPAAPATMASATMTPA